ncbi:MAG: hypothetical protein Q8M15_02905 [Bacteroidota bacterium]|nr:hypothetical protein [Bacteroidota bacterium]
MKKSVLLALLIPLLLNYSCKKDPPEQVPVSQGSLIVNIDYRVDGKPVYFDSLLYNNAAGNLYSVSRLEYYLSGFVIENENGELVVSDRVFYENARLPLNVSVNQLKPGNYKSVQFNVGLDALHNKSNALEPTPENINMIWPDEMGGGYHFTKFEGRYLKPDLTHSGFAMHIGTDKMLVQHNKLTVSLTISESTPDTLYLTMNLNEWFTNPNQYNLLIHGNYSMGNDTLMLMLKENAKDIFKISGN